MAPASPDTLPLLASMARDIEAHTSARSETGPDGHISFSLYFTTSSLLPTHTTLPYAHILYPTLVDPTPPYS